MSSNTPNLGLLKKDPMVDGNETFNIETMLNENWDKIDEAVGQVREDLDNVTVTVPDASLITKGITQLSNATNSTSESMAATPKAVKDAYDRGSVGITAAAAAQTKADAAETPVGSQAKANAAETNAKTYAENYTKQNSAIAAWSAGYRSAKHLSSGTDLNTVYDTGFYDGYGLGNAPSSSDWYFYQMISHSSGPTTWRTQIAYSFNDANSTFRRTQTNGNWSPWMRIGENLIDAQTMDVSIQVPGQYPTIQAAIDSLKKVNFGTRIIEVAANHIESGNVEIRGFIGGAISISTLWTGDANARFRINGNINVVNSTCTVNLSKITLNTAGAFINCQANVELYCFDIYKSVGGNGIWAGKCTAIIIGGNISNCTGSAISVFNSGRCTIRGVTGSNNSIGIDCTSGIVHIGGGFSLTASTLFSTSDGGRVFQGRA
ncbi:Phage tail fibre repeat-containing protein [Paenibacillus sp. cl141a]|uniref:pyocin knob domain-containing protein n=1 Tax=Paenibacillus sp. cl141a TaxID=1761877 RepID=UPI0008B3040B|nr:pyocin knob domain-containing protein [Paenibacillus sp. cl141a]SEK74248.1 Phage tail fibre repeat-containing protein [Paenibacillus sp. cl141a]